MCKNEVLQKIEKSGENACASMNDPNRWNGRGRQKIDIEQLYPCSKGTYLDIDKQKASDIVSCVLEREYLLSC
jgi:hypothetical protein